MNIVSSGNTASDLHTESAGIKQVSSVSCEGMALRMQRKGFVFFNLSWFSSSF